MMDRPSKIEWTNFLFVSMRYQYFYKNNITNSTEYCLRPDNVTFNEDWQNYTSGEMLWIGQEVNVTDPAISGGYK
jgi:hypothetical protein